MSIQVKDSDWLRQSLLLPKRSIDEVDLIRRTFTSDYRKFADTTLGGNAAINPAPQFTRFADVKARRFHQVGRGMGRYYSEVFDNNAVLVNMRFGVATFNSLTQFFGNFYNSDSARLARTGRDTGLAYFLGELAGFVVTIGFLPYIFVGQLFKFLVGKQQTKYYYLKPTMPLYWNAVQNILNTYTANTGMVQGLQPEQYGDADLNNGLSKADAAERNRLLPDIWRTDGSVDIIAVGTKHQRLANRQYAALMKIREDAADITDLKSKWDSFLATPIMENEFRPMNEYLRAYLSLSTSKPLPAESKAVNVSEPPAEGEAAGKATFLNEMAEGITDYFGKSGQPDASLEEFFLAELRDGSQFITLRVDNPGTASESFASTTRESDLAGTINGISSGARSARFSMAGGNIDDGIIGSVIGAGMQAVGDLAGGFLDYVGFSGLASLAGNAFVDMPKHWDGSTSNLPRMSYTIELRSPYGNAVSRFQNLIVPLAYLLAGALPLSTGTGSYTSPFLCELYCRGRAQSRLAMIDSLEITRGAGNIGWTQQGEPLGIDITFSVVDLSSVIHMPLTSNFGPLEPFKPGGLSRMFTSDDSSFGDYMAVLSGLGLTDQIYQTKKLKRNFYKAVLDFQDWASPSNWINYVGGLYPIRVISGFANGTTRA